MNEEKKIIKEVIEGNKDSFGEIIRRYGKRLYGFIYGIIGEEQDALDLVQETFLKAFENIKSFDTDKSFVTWLFTIGKNCSYNHVKAKKRRAINLEDCGSEFIENTSSGAFEPESEAIRNSERARLIEGISSLPEKYRVLICLKYIDGLSYKEISRRLNLKESLVESRIFTGRKKLAYLMKEGE